MYTSPSGKFSRPAAFSQVRPPTSTVMSVPSATIRSSRTVASRSITSAWRLDWAFQKAIGSGSLTWPAAYTKSSQSGSDMPASWAPAWHGKQVPHQCSSPASSRSFSRSESTRRAAERMATFSAGAELM